MRNPIVIILLLVGLGILGWIFFGPSPKPSYQWQPRISDKAYQPYDVGYFIDVLESSYKEDFELVRGTTQFEQVIDSGKGTMLYLNSRINLTPDHIEKLLEFVEKGNNAFFSSDIYPEGLIREFSGVFLDIESYDFNTLFTQEREKVNFGEVYTYNVEKETDVPLYIRDSTANVSFFNSNESYSFDYQRKDTLGVRNWLGIPKSQFDDYNSNLSLTPHSLINDSIIDMFSIKHGQGELFIHLNPILFGNYYFVEEYGFDYAQQMSKFFSDGKLYYNKRHYYVSRNSTNVDSKARSPFTFLLAHDSLRWAIYCLGILAIVYMLFGFKRRLPVLSHFSHPKNSSLRYVKALSSFYKKAGNHGDLCEEMIKNFEHFIRKRYSIKTDLPQDDLTPIMSKKSGIPEEDIKAIYNLKMKVEFGTDSLGPKTLKLHKAIEQFYKNCK